MTQYRHIFCDLLSNTVLAELPMTNVSYTQSLNTAGTATGELLLSGVNTVALNVFNGTLEEKCAWYIDRDGVIVWGGEIWTRDYDSSTQKLKIGAREFESYFEKRYITQAVSFANADQLEVARSIFNTAQAVGNGNIGIAVGTETSGVLISPMYYGYENRSIMGTLQELSRAVNGFDFNIFCAYDSSGNITKTLRLGYPRYGRAWSSTSQSASVLELPGNIIRYTYNADGTRGANTILSSGAGSNEGKLLYTAQDVSKLTSGWALHEQPVAYPQISDASILTNLAQGQLAAISTAPVTFQVVLPANVDPILGTYEIGDDIRLRIIDPLFPTGLDAVYRLVALNVVAGEVSGENVTMTLTVKTI